MYLLFLNLLQFCFILNYKHCILWLLWYKFRFLYITCWNACILTNVNLQHSLTLLYNIPLYEQVTIYPFSGLCLYIFRYLANAVVLTLISLAFASSGCAASVTLCCRDFCSGTLTAHLVHRQSTWKCLRAWSSLHSMTEGNLVGKPQLFSHLLWENFEVCSVPVFASTAHRGSLLIMHRLASCLSLSHISICPLTFPPQISYVHSDLCFGTYSWEPELRLLFKTCL